jgi:S-adenosylmethionine hydrolase
MMSELVALLTDFGTEDVYVGVMKGVMKRIAPDLQFVDITHAIRPQSVRECALALLHSYRFFPEGTVFLVVVDPGVGSQRRPVLVQAGGYRFVAPDNGVLAYVLEEIEAEKSVVLDNSHYHLSEISNTFHGRDIFAPAAAYAARGDIAFENFGTPTDELFSLPTPQLHVERQKLTGEVTHIDHFGNIITSIGVLDWLDDQRIRLQLPGSEKSRMFEAGEPTLIVHGQRIQGIVHAYHEVARGDLLVQIDSNGYLEIAINQGNAARRLDAAIGDEVQLNL